MQLRPRGRPIGPEEGALAALEFGQQALLFGREQRAEPAQPDLGFGNRATKDFDSRFRLVNRAEQRVAPLSEVVAQPPDQGSICW